MKRTLTRRALPLLAVASLTMALVACNNPPPTPSANTVPIIFVHGFYGSGDQYRAMGLYFASNGYPAERVLAFDHNSVGGTTTQADLNRFIDAARQRFGVSRVHLVGHSMGTAIVSQYMANTANRSKVDKYILVDGTGCSGTGRSCLAIRAATIPAGNASQTHVESSVSPESFARQYQFFLGRAPSVPSVTPETGPTIQLAGRLQELTVNTPVANTPVRFWAIDEATGHRSADSPAATATTGADGFFAPVTVPNGPAYEIEIQRAGGGTFHAYYQRFQRSDYLLRLNSVGPDSATVKNTNRGPGHASLAVVRNREFWRNHAGQNDVLNVKTTTSDGGGTPAIDVLSQATAQYVGVHLHDDAATPGQSSLAPLAYFSSQPFQTGVDVFMPAESPPDGTISITNLPRGDASKPQTINVPNWASSTDGMSVHFNDWIS
jgi:pimeloyl-ACP methyl ester carboxylesterase